MGNCLQTNNDQERQTKPKQMANGTELRNKIMNVRHRERLHSDIQNPDDPPYSDSSLRIRQTLPQEEVEVIQAQGDKDVAPQQQISGSTAVRCGGDGIKTAVTDQKTEKADPSWVRYLSQAKSRDDMAMDGDVSSAFGENWDPELFDRCGSPMDHSRYPNEEPMVRRNYTDKQSLAQGNKLQKGEWEKWASEESLAVSPKRNRLPKISSSVLGFSPLQPNTEDTTEWFRNGELESPQPNSTSFLIKGKQKQCERDDLNENPVDPEFVGSESATREVYRHREGWIRYTMFLHQERADICGFYAKLRNAKHVFLSLEAKTGCELRLSKRLFLHRGKLVRTVVIDGPSRKHILRCHSSLPSILTKLMIQECERPSDSDARPVVKTHCAESLVDNYQTVYQSTAVA
ncbi:hypothetical protein CRM22_009941 [Opisthorchis felineus]|uniref:Uncharacterized protein n=1 Tax=Opisthorchis felineus TaxID=147828 RepID=A0A4V3SCQ0_OPIFE|nr:hypothetical protein CRM22_009941 [Opisthorchis felineus]